MPKMIRILHKHQFRFFFWGGGGGIDFTCNPYSGASPLLQTDCFTIFSANKGLYRPR